MKWLKTGMDNDFSSPPTSYDPELSSMEGFTVPEGTLYRNASGDGYVVMNSEGVIYPYNPDASTSPTTPEVSTVTIEEIHEDFKGTVDRLLEEAKEIINKPKDKKAERYANLGFGNAPGVKEHNTQAWEQEQRKVLLDKINEYKVKYPTCQFLDDKSLDELCNKYALVYTSAEYFNQEIPEENLKDVEAFKLKAEDKIYRFVDARNAMGQVIYAYTETAAQSEAHYPNSEEAGFEVVATKDMFDIPSHMEFSGSKLQPKIVNDPIVLKRVPLGFLIITAWGPEAELPEVNIDKQ